MAASIVVDTSAFEKAHRRCVKTPSVNTANNETSDATVVQNAVRYEAATAEALYLRSCDAADQTLRQQLRRQRAVLTAKPPQERTQIPAARTAPARRQRQQRQQRRRSGRLSH